MERLSKNGRPTDEPTEPPTEPPASESPGKTSPRATSSEDWQHIKEIFDVEMRTCRELIDIEPTCRWPRLQLLYMIQNLQQMPPNRPGMEAMNGERAQLLAELLELDPTHAGYYRDCLRKASA